MKLSTFLTLAGILALLYGVAFILIPGPMLALYGMVADPPTVLATRYFALTLFNLGLLIYLARNSAEILAQRAILLAGCVGMALGLIVTIWGIITGTLNAMGWSTVIVYGVLLSGFLYFQFLKSGARSLSAT